MFSTFRRILTTKATLTLYKDKDAYNIVLLFNNRIVSKLNEHANILEPI